MRHRALDGTPVVLDGAFDLTAPSTSIAELIIAGRRHEFTSGRVELGEDLAGALGYSGFDDELAFAGGTLRVAGRRSYDSQTRIVEHTRLIAWHGERHSLVTQIYLAADRAATSTATAAESARSTGTADTTGTADASDNGIAAALGTLRPLRLAEHRDGLVIDPDPDQGAGFAGPAVIVKEVPGLGLLQIAPPPRSGMLRPYRPDRPAGPAEYSIELANGILAVDRLPDGHRYFRLETGAFVATVLPLADTGPDPDPAGVAELLDRLTITRGEPAWSS